MNLISNLKLEKVASYFTSNYYQYRVFKLMVEPNNLYQKTNRKLDASIMRGSVYFSSNLPIYLISNLSNLI